MALISCPECGKQISDKASSCPHCGNPMNPQPQQIVQPQKKNYFCCPECGTEFNYKAKTCPHCGCSLGKPTQQVKELPLCSNCGSQLREGVTHCQKCGTKVSSNTEEANHDKKSNNDFWVGCLIFLIPICFLCMGVYLCSGDDNPKTIASGYTASDDEEASANMETVNVEQMQLDLEQNEMRAQKKYANKWFEIVGRLGGMDSEGEYFSLRGEEFSMVAVNCDIPKDKREKITNILANMNKGELIAVKGKVTDMGELMGYEVSIVDVYRKSGGEQDLNNSPIIGSKDVSLVKKKLPGSIWTFTDKYKDVYWTKLVFSKDKCKVYSAIPQDGKWTFTHETPYYVVEKRLYDGKRYVFVYLKYTKDGEELPNPMGINITEGSFIYGALGAIGLIDEIDYVWD